MPDILRVYDPAECNGRGVPLDWERCRTCSDPERPRIDLGVGADWVRPCPVCDSHGSLKAAALAALLRRGRETIECVELDGEMVPLAEIVDGVCAVCGEADEHRHVHLDQPVVRCEGCGHRMSEGTWEPIAGLTDDDYRFVLAGGGIAEQTAGRHYSPCDEGCRHGGEIASLDNPSAPLRESRTIPVDRSAGGLLVPTGPTQRTVEASWRRVDVRTLGWPHDLRPEKLAVLCLRCYAERTSTPRQT